VEAAATAAAESREGEGWAGRRRGGGEHARGGRRGRGEVSVRAGVGWGVLAMGWGGGRACSQNG
jgi:hypothetical protein